VRILDSSHQIIAIAPPEGEKKYSSHFHQLFMQHQREKKNFNYHFPAQPSRQILPRT